MFKEKVIGALALTVLMGLGVVGVNAAASTPTPVVLAQQPAQISPNYATYSDGENSGVMSYDDADGDTWYSEDNGATWLTETQFSQKHPTPVYEWWTYDEYKAWLAKEKETLQEMADTSAEIETSAGKYVWTQELTDETIAQYEKILEDIKNGWLISKSVNGDTNGMASYHPNDIATTTGYEFTYETESGEQIHIGPFESKSEYDAALKEFCAKLVVEGKMTQSEANAILKNK